MQRPAPLCLALCILSATSLTAQTFVMPGDGSRTAVATCGGVVQDPGGAVDYTNGQSGELTIYPDRPSTLIELELEEWDVAPGDDLNISGGSTTGRTLLTTAVTPIQVGDRFVANSLSSSALTLWFRANSGLDRPGFELRVRCVPDGPILMGDQRLHVLQGKTFTDSGGVDADYSNDENLTTRFRSLRTIELAFQTVDIDPCCDELSLSSSLGFPLGTVTGPSFFYWYRDLDAAFSSDGSISGAGWFARIREFTTHSNVASGFGSTPERVQMVHPDDPENPYPPNVSASAGYVLPTPDDDLDIAVFVEPLLGEGDELKIYGGLDDSAPLLETFGFGSPNRWLVQPGSHHAHVAFTSDATSEGAFLATWYAVATMHQDRTATLCDRDFVDSGGLEGDYGPNEDVTLVLRPDNPAAWIQVVFDSFDTEAGVDTLTAYDGDSTAAPVIGTWSGSSLPPTLSPSSRAPGAALTLRFVSDSQSETFGFHGRALCRYGLFVDGFESADTTAWSSVTP